MYYYSFDSKTEYLALGAVKNISLNITISNKGDDAYDTNVFFNFSKELYFIKMWQEVRNDVHVVNGLLYSYWAHFFLVKL